MTFFKCKRPTWTTPIGAWLPETYFLGAPNGSLEGPQAALETKIRAFEIVKKPLVFIPLGASGASKDWLRMLFGTFFVYIQM